jgi:hypothetical protein
MIWARMLAYVTGMVNQELLLRNEYLAAENRILRGQIKGRLLLSEGEHWPRLLTGWWDSRSCVAIAHIYKDACRLAQAKGLARLIYHEPALEVRFVRKAMGTTSFLTIRE